MKIKYLIIIFILIVSIFPRVVSASQEEKDILIKYNKDLKPEDVSTRYKVNIDNIEEIKNLEVFKIDQTSWWQRVKINFDKTFFKDISYVETDSEYQVFNTPNDPELKNQWAIPKISAFDGWDISTGSPAIKIAIVDTGINGTHEDLSGKVLDGYNFVTDTPISANSNSDDYGHGSSVASVASAVTNNSKGMAGVDWQAKLIPVKVLNQNGSGSSFDVAAGIVYAADHGAKIINLSLGGGSLSETMKNALDYATDQKGALVIAASGNSNTAISYPAKYQKVLAVGASNSSDNRWYKSNFGPELDILAPGESIFAVNKNGGYRYATGTSLATPYVSGLAALIWSKNTSFTNKQIEDFIKNNADKISAMEGKDFNDCCGYGRINIYKSLSTGSGYQASWISQNSNPNIITGGSYNFFVRVKNTGTTTWQKNSVRLVTDKPLGRNPVFAKGDGWISGNRVEMQEDKVAPGETASFSFWMSVPEGLAPGTYREYFGLMVEGVGLMDDLGISWDIKVLSKKDAYTSCQWVSQNAYPNLMSNQSYNFYVRIKNTGATTWEKNIVHLGTDRPQDRSSVFKKGGGWVSNNRIEMQEDKVAPGETASFSFWMSVPEGLAPGTYREYFRLVADGITWMDDWGIYWDVRIEYPHASWAGQSEYPKIHPGESATVWIEFKNTGNISWNKTGENPVNLGTDRPRDRVSFFKDANWLSPNRISLDKSTVSPGETGRYTFSFFVPDDATPGTYQEYFRPVSDGLMWLEDYGVFLSITVY